MPFIKVQTNQNVENKEEILKKLSAKMADKLGKPESYVMTGLDSKLTMTFGGSTEKTAFIEVKSIGLSESMTDDLSKFICDFLEKEVGVKKNRVYIQFVNAPGSMWGWDGGTF